MKKQTLRTINMNHRKGPTEKQLLGYSGTGFSIWTRHAGHSGYRDPHKRVNNIFASREEALVCRMANGLANMESKLRETTDLTRREKLAKQIGIRKAFLQKITVELGRPPDQESPHVFSTERKSLRATSLREERAGNQTENEK